MEIAITTSSPAPPMAILSKPAVRSVIESGLEGSILDVECHLSNNLPTIVIVGYASRSVDEAKERVRGAFASAGLRLVRKRITVNLAPADIPKDGTSYDLAIATAILGASGLVVPDRLPKDMAIVGELGLDGSVRAVRGIIGKCLAAKRLGFSSLVIPKQNLAQALLVPGLSLRPVERLAELAEHLQGGTRLSEVQTGDGIFEGPLIQAADTDFQQVVGQQQAKRAFEIAAAGHHNILLSGSPGTGKTMLARALISILPPLTKEEALVVTHLHSLAARKYEQIMYNHPLRAPHHSASDSALSGGGVPARPGEISLAHGGILFLDELPEFRRSAIEALRQPLEDRQMTIARARESVTFPADFILVATRNPCPCGYFGSDKPCQCDAASIQRYRKKLSGPIMDRIDLYVEAEKVQHDNLLASGREEPSQTIAVRVQKARQRGLERAATLNGRLTNDAIKRTAKLRPSALELLNTAAASYGLSARAYMRTIRVARTIADLDGSTHIELPHISEAFQFRPILPSG